MASLQKYFSYRFTLRCGIPSITLLGTPADWHSLSAKVDKFAEFGVEPTKWVALLRPVCNAFEACFDPGNLEQSYVSFSRLITAKGERLIRLFSYAS